MKIVDASQYGPMFRFTDANVYWALYILSDGKRIGRKRLAKKIGVGEGSMRHIIDILRHWGMICTKQTGIIITHWGLSFFDNIPIKIVDIDLNDFVVGDYSQSVLVYGVSNKIENGMQQRDAGIKVGSNGCTTFVFRNGALMVPPDWNVDEKNFEIATKIRQITNITENDVLIVGSANDQNTATIAALTAAFDLL